MEVFIPSGGSSAVALNEGSDSREDFETCSAFKCSDSIWWMCLALFDEDAFSPTPWASPCLLVPLVPPALISWLDKDIFELLSRS